MASPQAENGHIDIANEIAEQFCRYRISGEEWMVLWAIIRKTYGWKKKEDRIALSQFAVMTGLKKPHIVRALRKLQSKRIIIVIKNDTTDINSYRFNKDFDKWESLSKKIPSYFKESSLKPFCYLCGFSDAIEEHHINLRSDGGSDRVENKIILCPNCHTLVHKGKYTPEFLRTKKDTTEKTIIKIDNPINEIGVSKKIHTKDTTKDTITKEKTDSDFSIFYSAYPNKKAPKKALEVWKKLNGNRPPVDQLLEAIKKQIEWRKNANGEFRPEWKHPATWLNQGCWMDEVEIKKEEKKKTWNS